jgi:hypothetical protein
LWRKWYVSTPCIGHTILLYKISEDLVTRLYE